MKNSKILSGGSPNSSSNTSRNSFHTDILFSLASMMTQFDEYKMEETRHVRR